MKHGGREVIFQQPACDKARLGRRFSIDDKECSQLCGRKGSWLKKVFISITILSLLSPLLCYGVDLAGGIRHMQKHGAWMSLEFRQGFGMFFASRASTVDEIMGATLNLTFVPKKQCQSVSVLVIKLDSLSSKKIQEEATIEIKVDNEPHQRITATFMVEAGDKFAFYDISKNFKDTELSEHDSVKFSIESFGSTKFRLNGFDKARKEAQSTCEAFMPSDTTREK